MMQQIETIKKKINNIANPSHDFVSSPFLACGTTKILCRNWKTAPQVPFADISLAYANPPIKAIPILIWRDTSPTSAPLSSQSFAQDTGVVFGVGALPHHQEKY
jgi:hypothetical protein